MFKILLVLVVVCSWSAEGATLAADRQGSTTADSTDNKWAFSDVKSQGSCTGCGYAFAAAAVMESCYARTYGRAPSVR